MFDSIDNCLEAIQHIHPYLDAELSPELALLICQHLVECDTCEDVFEVQAEIKVRIRNGMEVEPGTLDKLNGALRHICEGQISQLVRPGV